MNFFQYLTLPGLALAFFAEMIGLLRKPAGRKSRLVRVGVWALAALAIAYPQIPQAVASQLGISRGADLILYLFVLAFLAASFYFYSRYFRLQGQLTDVVRHLAIQNARHCRDQDRG
jgi:hypothetical protein